VEHGKRYVTFSALHHLHIDAKGVGKLSRKKCITLFKAIDKHLKRRTIAASLKTQAWTLFKLRAARALAFACEMDNIGVQISNASNIPKENFMGRLKTKEPVAEVECSACEGTGFPKVKQPVQPGRKIYPPPCNLCRGKGWLAAKR